MPTHSHKALMLWGLKLICSVWRGLEAEMPLLTGQIVGNIRMAFPTLSEDASRLQMILGTKETYILLGQL